MAKIFKPKSEGSHWYLADGTPFHRVPYAKKDGTRAVTLADARKKNALPSATNALGILAKYGLENYWKSNAVMAALNHPKEEGESLEYWVRRVVAASDTPTSDAATLGTDVHAAIEDAMAGKPYDETLSCYVKPALKCLRDHGFELLHAEHVVVNRADGYAGTADMIGSFPDYPLAVVDVKTRKSTNGFNTYSTDRMQLAAYHRAYYGAVPQGRSAIANLYISTSEPGKVELVFHPDIAGEYEAFQAACLIWRRENNYDPRHV